MVKRYEYHEKYENDGNIFQEFDIGLIESQKSFELGPTTNIYPVCVSFKTYDSFKSGSLWVAGYGHWQLIKKTENEIFGQSTDANRTEKSEMKINFPKNELRFAPANFESIKNGMIKTMSSSCLGKMICNYLTK